VGVRIGRHEISISNPDKVFLPTAASGHGSVHANELTRPAETKTVS